MSDRPHGYARYRLDGCRCEVCGTARREYDRRRVRRTAQGRWQPFVEPGPARAHAEALRAAGLGTRQIAALAGINRKALQDVLNGSTGRIRPATAAALLAVPLTAEVAAKTVVPAVGTHRCQQALAAAGWSLTMQAAEVGWTVSNYFGLLRRTAVIAQTARLVRDLYERWQALPPPEGHAANLARRRAREKSWFPPFAWDDDIDNPDALPCLLPPVEPVDRDLELLVQHLAAGHPAVPTTAARLEVVRRTDGWPAAEIAAVARCSPDYVWTLRSRLGLTRRSA
ncbi:hypothetical protein ACQP1P_38765 [Dactylosporangium sp. CA-052675]|uniref:hypothetical protein n=1 Tax=Dactylosporangium sp. CA-052675 TaxID=3239927 RepID=UPI003D927126